MVKVEVKVTLVVDVTVDGLSTPEVGVKFK